MSMAAAQTAATTEVLSSAMVIFDGGVRPPVAPTGTLTRLADRWFCIVRAIDSSISRTVVSNPGGGLDTCRTGQVADDALPSPVQPLPALPMYVGRPRSVERSAGTLPTSGDGPGPPRR